MNVKTTSSVLVATVMGVGTMAAAQVSSIVMDGAADAAYGDPVAVQNTNTQFGDASDGTAGFCNGSEIDGLYAFVADGYLHLLVAGNLESNFNKLEIFIDAIPGEGQNPILGNNNGIDFNALNTMGEFVDGETGEVQPGLSFDAAFVPDFWVTFTGGQGTGPKGEPVYDTYCNYAALLTGGGDTGAAGGAGPGSAGAKRKLVLDNGIEAAIDNSNVAGVIGGTELNEDGGAGVTTGIEIAIPLAALGHTAGDDIGVSAMVNATGHDFLSNQVIGGIGGGDNLGFPRFVNFDVIEGDQFVVIATEGGGGENDCPADFDGNRVVNGADFGSVLAAWGPCPGCPQDLDGDDQVAGSDVGAFLAAWGDCPDPPAATGACCTGDGCSELTESDCADAGGTYLGDDTSCDVDSCDTGGGDCGDCNVAQAGSPGCSDTACQDAICATDNFCCTVEWDSSCVAKANSGNFPECDCP